jgi:ferrous iron transport protein A
MQILYECEKGIDVKVVKLNVEKTLKQRLISFGIMKGSTITVIEHAPAKSTIEVKVGKMRIALRDQEAKGIEVIKL